MIWTVSISLPPVLCHIPLSEACVPTMTVKPHFSRSPGTFGIQWSILCSHLTHQQQFKSFDHSLHATVSQLLPNTRVFQSSSYFTSCSFSIFIPGFPFPLFTSSKTGVLQGPVSSPLLSLMPCLSLLLLVLPPGCLSSPMALTPSMCSGSWWWTGKPGVLRFMGSQRVGHDWATELNWCAADPLFIFLIQSLSPEPSMNKGNFLSF